MMIDDDDGDDDDYDDDYDDDDDWLVVWNHGFFADFPYIGNVIIPTDFHNFQRGRYTTNQFILMLVVMMIILLLSFNVESYNRSNDVDHRKISHRQFIMCLNDNTHRWFAMKTVRSLHLPSLMLTTMTHSAW